MRVFDNFRRRASEHAAAMAREVQRRRRARWRAVLAFLATCGGIERAGALGPRCDDAMFVSGEGRCALTRIVSTDAEGRARDD